MMRTYLLIDITIFAIIIFHSHCCCSFFWIKYSNVAIPNLKLNLGPFGFKIHYIVDIGITN